MKSIQKYVVLANILDKLGHYEAAKTVDNFLIKIAIGPHELEQFSMRVKQMHENILQFHEVSRKVPGMTEQLDNMLSRHYARFTNLFATAFPEKFPQNKE